MALDIVILKIPFDRLRRNRHFAPGPIRISATNMQADDFDGNFISCLDAVGERRARRGHATQENVRSDNTDLETESSSPTGIAAMRICCLCVRAEIDRA